ncbi:uncharacterized protein BT62DRAFT_896358 [Guyanagaster necrorhizus]|uniref:Uncharacterized protein n=1 Tax=Guyanagaster necrorhizus TaxID=856835 RepID=A0A9P7VQI5_9AGAR|nr:uncharacterized protein BT62DRAFT_896358 [Guyanagaster necrorhizus MCA 3950]KAG7445576.1 hypothetical protein BT62DRAFT_896358 [Guyanagaster necrorhizus MCA 3950]
MSQTGVDFATAVKQEATYLRLVHPTPDDIPSCFRLMELAMGCHGIRSQVKSWYRQGESSRCAYKHDDFKFCLSMKWMESDERYEAWINRRAEWWARRRLDKSSEDVWAMRMEPRKSFPRPVTDKEIQSVLENTEETLM